PHSTNLQRSKLVERSNRLFRKIEAWLGIQVLYTLTVVTLRLQDDQLARGDKLGELGEGKHIGAIDVKLYLPLAVVSRGVLCEKKYQELEWRLCYAQAQGIIDDLCRAILLIADVEVKRQACFEANACIPKVASVTSRIDRGRQKYMEVKDAFDNLAAVLHRHMPTLEAITAEDTVGLTLGEDKRAEGSRSESWIWRVTGGDQIEGEGKQEALWIECCKSRARAQRWQEECLLINEEMRHVIACYKHQERLWLDCGSAAYPFVDQATAGGMRAYAVRQANGLRRQVIRCENKWAGMSRQLTTGVSAPLSSDSSQYQVEHGHPLPA
ncbi:hypothetical protein C0991_008064, partial [Blastosporella zonata]